MATSPIETAASPAHGARLVRYGGNTLVMVLLCIGVILAVNLAMTKIPARWDLTGQGLYSLSDQTVKILDNLNQPVKMTAFYSQNLSPVKSQAQPLLKEYQAHSDKIELEFVDPDQRPTLAQQMGVGDGTIVVQSGDRRQDVTAPNEAQITGALLKVTSDQQTTVYFLTGHGERSPDDADQTGLSTVRRLLQQDNFNVQQLNLATVTNDDWKQGVLVINAGTRVVNVGGQVRVTPISPLLDAEQQKLSDFLKNGGRALLLLGPASDATYADLLQPYGLKLADGIAVDPALSLGDITAPAVQRPESSPMTDALPITVFPGAAAIVDGDQKPAGLTARPLMQTSQDSWLETDQRTVRYDEGQDTKGPLRLAVSIEGPVQGAAPVRVVAVTSVDAFSNGVLSFRGLGNADFFLNIVNWLAQQEQAIGIRAKDTTAPTVALTQAQFTQILLSSAALIPGLIFGLGVITWWRRR